jgi:hypothetical protein
VIVDAATTDRHLRSEFPAKRTRAPTTPESRFLTSFNAAVLLAMAGVLVFPAISRADEGDPPLHHVKYSVWSETPVHAQIYYRDTDPPTFADYSHNPYQYSPGAEADIGPNQPRVLDVMLANPNQWAMVIGTKPRSTDSHAFHCVLAVDGAVLVVNGGLKGALCSIRQW